MAERECRLGGALALLRRGKSNDLI